MTPAQHYEDFLAPLYSWITGDFNERVKEQRQLFEAYGFDKSQNWLCADLGSGHGIQSVALAQMGHRVVSVDSNRGLLLELELNAKGFPVTTEHSDLITFMEGSEKTFDLVGCMGDTLTHLASFDEVEKLLALISMRLAPAGRVLFSFRDYSKALEGAARFIPVKSDGDKILTCFLDFRESVVIVHDIIHEKKGDQWNQRISTYPKLRIAPEQFKSLLKTHHFRMIDFQQLRGMMYFLSEKI